MTEPKPNSYGGKLHAKERQERWRASANHDAEHIHHQMALDSIADATIEMLRLFQQHIRNPHTLLFFGQFFETAFGEMAQSVTPCLEGRQQRRRAYSIDRLAKSLPKILANKPWYESRESDE